MMVVKRKLDYKQKNGFSLTLQEHRSNCTNIYTAINYLEYVYCHHHLEIFFRFVTLQTAQHFIKDFFLFTGMLRRFSHISFAVNGFFSFLISLLQQQQLLFEAKRQNNYIFHFFFFWENAKQQVFYCRKMCFKV